VKRSGNLGANENSKKVPTDPAQGGQVGGELGWNRPKEIKNFKFKILIWTPRLLARGLFIFLFKMCYNRVNLKIYEITRINRQFC